MLMELAGAELGAAAEARLRAGCGCRARQGLRRAVLVFWEAPKRDDMHGRELR